MHSHKFSLVTDHQPLTTILIDKKGIFQLASVRLQRLTLQLSNHHCTIQFQPTRTQANADGLSTLLIKKNYRKKGHSEPNLFNICQIESPPRTTGQLKQATRTDPVLSKVLANMGIRDS